MRILSFVVRVVGVVVGGFGIIHGPIALWLVGALVVAAGVGLRLLAPPRVCAPAWRATPDAPIVRAAYPPPFPPGGFRWVGASNVPTPLGRMRASGGLAALTVVPGHAKIEFRPRFLGSIYGYRPTDFPARPETVVFPIRGLLGRPGVGFQVGTGPPFYFFIRLPEPVLGSLVGCGFAVRVEQVRLRPKSYLWP